MGVRAAQSLIQRLSIIDSPGGPAVAVSTSDSSAATLAARLAADPMIAAVRGLPEHFGAGWHAAGQCGIDLRGSADRVVVTGLGGSAFPADLLSLAVSCPVTVSRDYVVHSPLDERTVVIASSFSGNTEETLAAFEDAGRRGAARVVVTSGGRLAELAADAGVAVVRLEKPFPSFQPRAATAMFVGAFGRLCQNLGLATDLEAAFERVSGRIRGMDDVDDRAAELALALSGRIPVILATAPFGESVARIIKIKCNENAKIAAFWNVVPGFNHNELVGFTECHGPFSAVLLRDPGCAPRLAHRVEMTRRALVDNGVPVHVVELPDATALEKAFSALYLFDFVTCRLALQAGLDPNPVAMIESFKASLGPYHSTAD